LRFVARRLPGAFRYLPGRPDTAPDHLALANPTLDERQVLMAVLDHDKSLHNRATGQPTTRSLIAYDH
jgi:hypothetical protein